MTNRTDAILDRRLDDLLPTDEVKSLQLFIDDAETPIVSCVDGEWLVKSARPWTTSIGLHGDDGWLYYQDRDGVVLNRITNWKPPLPEGYFAKKTERLQSILYEMFATIR